MEITRRQTEIAKQDAKLKQSKYLRYQVQLDKLQFKIEAARQKHNLLLDALKQLTNTKNA